MQQYQLPIFKSIVETNMYLNQKKVEIMLDRVFIFQFKSSNQGSVIVSGGITVGSGNNFNSQSH
jgi:hypothetical protein